MMPARMEGIFSFVCRKAVMKPAAAPAIMAAGRPLGLAPAGLGCRDTLRFEACMPLYGHELSAAISPVEARLTKFVSFAKGEFNGREVLARQVEYGPPRKLVGFALTERGLARAEYPVMADGRRIGTVTTGSYAPTLDKNLGMALVEANYAKAGGKIAVEIRGKEVAAEIIARPFYKREGKKA